MEPRSLKPDLTYLKQLVGAGWDGIAFARHEMRDGVFSPPLETVVWTPTAVGAAIGLLSTQLSGKRNRAR